MRAPRGRAETTTNTPGRSWTKGRTRGPQRRGVASFVIPQGLGGAEARQLSDEKEARRRARGRRDGEACEDDARVEAEKDCPSEKILVDEMDDVAAEGESRHE